MLGGEAPAAAARPLIARKASGGGEVACPNAKRPIDLTIAEFHSSVRVATVPSRLLTSAHSALRASQLVQAGFWNR